MSVRRWVFETPWAILSATFIVYASTLTSSFHFDDYSLFQDALVTAPGLPFEFFGAPYSRSLTFVSFWLNYQVGGEDAFGYHVVNVALHLGSVAVAWRVFTRILDARTAWFATALFALHPLQTEPVSYVYGRASVIATLFCLLSLKSWLDGRRWIAVGWFCASLLGKEEALMFPVMLVGIDWLRGELRWLRVARPLVAMFGAVGVVSVRLIYAIRVTPDVGVAFDVEGVSPGGYLLTQGAVIVEYLRLLAVGWGQNFDRVWAVAGVGDVWAWLGWAAVALLVGASARFLRDGDRIGAGGFALCGLLLLVPTSSVIPLADLIAERRMYLPMTGFAPAVALIFSRVARGARWQPLALGAVLLMSAVTATRTTVWRTEESLWRDVVSRSPGKVRPLLQLARAVEEPEERAALLENARSIDPNSVDASLEYGVFLLQSDRSEEALAEFQRAESLDPAEPNAIANQGAALVVLGRTTEALHAYRRTLDLDPCHQDARANLVDLLRAQGMGAVADEWAAGGCE